MVNERQQTPQTDIVLSSIPRFPSFPDGIVLLI